VKKETPFRQTACRKKKTAVSQLASLLRCSVACLLLGCTLLLAIKLIWAKPHHPYHSNNQAKKQALTMTISNALRKTVMQFAFACQATTIPTADDVSLWSVITPVSNVKNEATDDDISLDDDEWLSNLLDHKDDTDHKDKDEWIVITDVGNDKDRDNLSLDDDDAWLSNVLDHKDDKDKDHDEWSVVTDVGNDTNDKDDDDILLDDDDWLSNMLSNVLGNQETDDEWSVTTDVVGNDTNDKDDDYISLDISLDDDDFLSNLSNLSAENKTDIPTNVAPIPLPAPAVYTALLSFGVNPIQQSVSLQPPDAVPMTMPPVATPTVVQQSGAVICLQPATFQYSPAPAAVPITTIPPVATPFVVQQSGAVSMQLDDDYDASTNTWAAQVDPMEVDDDHDPSNNTWRGSSLSSPILPPWHGNFAFAVPKVFGTSPNMVQPNHGNLGTSPTILPPWHGQSASSAVPMVFGTSPNMVQLPVPLVFGTSPNLPGH
jgi:hypothetical protein